VVGGVLIAATEMVTDLNVITVVITKEIVGIILIAGNTLFSMTDYGSAADRITARSPLQ
jgi:hypothetical protein